MNVYEDKYLRDKISLIIAWQKEGKVVISAYKDGSGLPAREDLGQALARAAYLYDYAVGNSGFLNYDSDVGACQRRFSAYKPSQLSETKRPAAAGLFLAGRAGLLSINGQKPHKSPIR